MKKSRISRLVDFIYKAAWDLGIKPDPKWVEEIALSVYTAMDHPARIFHRLDHAFGIADGKRGIGIFAALYHDIVYLQVDGSIPERLEHIVNAYIYLDADSFTLKPEEDLPAWIMMTAKIFGVIPKETLIKGQGTNEFFSALCAAEQLHEVLSDVDLIRVVSCIEATIPFRYIMADGKSCFDHLESNIGKALEDIKAPGCEKTLSIVHEATEFANSDVEGFSMVDSCAFLVETWKLYTEMNPTLKQANSYFFQSYRESLVNGLNFFLTLEPDKVFRAHKNYPDTMTNIKRTEQAIKNIEIAIKYIEAKLLAIGIMEAIADITGGDAPISFFLGEMGGGEEVEHIEDYFSTPPYSISSQKAESNEVYRLLAWGRRESDFELKASPLSTYIYDCLGEAEILNLRGAVKSYFDLKMGSMDFLKLNDYDMLVSILKACSKVCRTRRENIELLMEELKRDAA